MSILKSILTLLCGFVAIALSAQSNICLEPGVIEVREGFYLATARTTDSTCYSDVEGFYIFIKPPQFDVVYDTVSVFVPPELRCSQGRTIPYSYEYRPSYRMPRLSRKQLMHPGQTLSVPSADAYLLIESVEVPTSYNELYIDCSTDSVEVVLERRIMKTPAAIIVADTLDESLLKQHSGEMTYLTGHGWTQFMHQQPYRDWFDEGLMVVYIQQKLAALEYDIEVTGLIDDQTRAALEVFKAEFNIEPSEFGLDRIGLLILEFDPDVKIKKL